jgi:hypothetical protein
LGVSRDEAVEAMWAASARAYHSRRQEEMRAAWCAYHERMAESIERTAAELAAEHRQKAENLTENGHEERA